MSASFFALEWSFATAVIAQDTHRIGEASSSLFVYFSARKQVAAMTMVISYCNFTKIKLVEGKVSVC